MCYVALMEGKYETRYRHLSRVLYASNEKNIIKPGLELLIKLCENIKNQPLEAKYKSFRCKNSTIKKKLLSMNGISLVLNSLGFYLKNIEMSSDSLDSSKEFKVMPREEKYILIPDFDEELFNWFCSCGLEALTYCKVSIGYKKIKIKLNYSFLSREVLFLHPIDSKKEDLYTFVENLAAPKYSHLMTREKFNIKSAEGISIEDDSTSVPKSIFGSTLLVFKALDEEPETVRRRLKKEAEEADLEAKAKLKASLYKKYRKRTEEKQQIIEKRAKDLAEFNSNRTKNLGQTARGKIHSPEKSSPNKLCDQ